MGLFGKIQAALYKKSVPDNALPGKPEMITVYDKFGREMLISRQQWREKVLPGSLTQHENNPEALYSTIFMALNDGFAEDILEATKRLMAIDPIPERSHTVRAIALMKTGDLDGAEATLSAFIEQHGATGSVLTNLAKIYAERGDPKRSEATLWEGLKLDPNQDNGLLWWAVIHRERDGEAGYLEAMRQAAHLDGSWRPQLWLARHCLEQKDLAGAKQYYDRILATAADQPGVLMMVSGNLGKNGYVEAALELVAPRYDPEKHDPATGFNILQGYVETKNHVDGEKLLHRIASLDRPELIPWKQHLMHYSAEFEKLRIPPLPPANTDKPLEASAIRIDRPVWTYGLNDPKWLFQQSERRGKSVAFISLANTSPSGAKVPFTQREDDLGRLTRSIPLFLAESLFCWTDLKPTAVIPVVMGTGPIVSGMEWPPEQISAFAGDVDVAVTGSLNEQNGTLRITLMVWDSVSKKAVNAFSYTCDRDHLGSTVLTIERKLLDYFSPLSGKPDVPVEGFYVRPAPAIMASYLSCLGQTLMMTFVQNEYVPREQMWGERQMFDSYLWTVAEMKDAQVPRVLFLAALAKSRAYGSSAYEEYKARALRMLGEEKSRASQFYRLSPLLFQVFGMESEFNARKAELARDADPLYLEWLDHLGK